MTHPTRMTPTAPAESSGPRTFAARGFYVGLVVVMMGVVLAGFWPFYAALFTGGPGGVGARWFVYAHAAVFSGWMALVLAQVILVYRRRVRVHQRLGRVGIYYGLLVLLTGLIVTVLAPVQDVAQGRAPLDAVAGFLILPIGDLILFGGFFAAGIAYRRRVELHKRLMVLATIALLFPAAARAAGDAGPLVSLPIWLFPLALAMGYDALTCGRVARVYTLGLIVLLVAFARIALMESELWLPIGRRILLAALAW